MRSQIKQAKFLHRKCLFILDNLSLRLRAVLTIGLSLTLLASWGWHESAAAQESTVAVGAANAIDELSSINLLPGALDITFGGDGTIITDVVNKLDDSAYAVAVQTDGKVVAVGVVSTGSTGKDFAVIRLNPNGVLDTTFSDDGKLTFNFNSATRDDIARAVTVQADGKIVIAGEADVLGFGNSDIAVARLNADGSFDTSFGNNGKVTTNLPNNRADYGRSLALQPDGKILVAGYSNRPTTGDDFIVVRYGANGLLDTTFDGDGIVTTDILTNREDRAASLGLHTDGRIVVAGYASDPSFKNNFAVVRYNANGALDSSFNGTGKLTTDLNLNSDDIGNALTIQGDDKIIVAGQCSGDIGLVRYHTNGVLDTTFGSDGIVTTNFGTGAIDIGRGVVVQSNGKITVAGRSRSELAFARYNPDGTLDKSFDVDGLLVQNTGNNFSSGFGGVWGVALQADDKIVAAGDGWRDGFRNDFAVSRLNPDGTFDLSFEAGDGMAATDVNGRFDEAGGVAIQPDGKIVVAGTAQNSTGGYDIVVARYKTDGKPDASFSGDGIAVTDIRGHADEGGYAVALQPDGKILVAGKTANASDGNLDDGVLIRYNSNGTLDTTFGNGGLAIMTGSYVSRGGLAWVQNRSVAVQPDGKIVVAGEAHYFSVRCDGLVARYNSNGTVDASFGGPAAGVTLIDVNVNDTFRAVALQADGKIVAAGWSDVGTNAATTDFLLTRLNSNGGLDTSFDLDGKVLTNFDNGHYDAAYDLAIQGDGKIVAAGETVSSGAGNDFAIARYNLNGSLDTAFGGGDGKANIDFLNHRDYCSGVAIQPDGKIVMAGFADALVETGFGVVKLNANGTLDTTFGGGSGKVRTLFGDAVGSALNPAPADMALQVNGKIVVVGRINLNSTNHDLVVIRYLNESPACTAMLNPAGQTFAAGGGSGFVNVALSAGCEWTATSEAAWITITSGTSGLGSGAVNFSVAANAGAERVGVLSVANQTFTITQQGSVAAAPSLQFGQINYSVAEGGGLIALTVTRSGNSSGTTSVDYRTEDADTFTVGCADTVNNRGAAYARCDFATVVGTLSFSAGETTKIINVPVIDDVHAEAAETFQLRLSNASGATLGVADAATVTIQDNDAAGASNPVISSNPFFVRQQYLDFLSREPDTGGFNAWLAVLNGCSNIFTPSNVPSSCDRIFVSGEGFFRSQEFQLKGFYVFRFYKVAFNRLPEYLEVVADMSFVAGQTAEEVYLRKAQLATLITQRPEFVNTYGGMTNAQYVSALLGRYGLTQLTTPDPADPDGAAKVSLSSTELTNRLSAGSLTRAQVMRAVADSEAVGAREFNNAFVGMQYYGYLRRRPDQGGFAGWLRVLQSGDVRTMVNGFLNSTEYKLRFGQP